MSFENVNILDEKFYFGNNVWRYYPMQIHQPAVTFILFYKKKFYKNLYRRPIQLRKEKTVTFVSLPLASCSREVKRKYYKLSMFTVYLQSLFFFLIHIVFQSCLWCLHLSIWKKEKNTFLSISVRPILKCFHFK